MGVICNNHIHFWKNKVIQLYESMIHYKGQEHMKETYQDNSLEHQQSPRRDTKSKKPEKSHNILNIFKHPLSPTLPFGFQEKRRKQVERRNIICFVALVSLK